MFLKKTILLSLLFFTCVCNDASADTASLKIGFVDLAKIEEGSLAVRDLNKQIQEKESVLKKQLLSRKNTIESRNKELEKQSSVIARDVLEKKAKDIEEEYTLLQIDERMYSQVLELSKVKSLQAIQESIKIAANDISQDYDIVLTSQSVLYIKDQKFDNLTLDLIDKLNRSTRKVDFNANFDKIIKEAKTSMKAKK
jgi:Skp family chaperone for outer membrane proteins